MPRTLRALDGLSGAVAKYCDNLLRYSGSTSRANVIGECEGPNECLELVPAVGFSTVHRSPAVKSESETAANVLPQQAIFRRYVTGKFSLGHALDLTLPPWLVAFAFFLTFEGPRRTWE